MTVHTSKTRADVRPMLVRAGHGLVAIGLTFLAVGLFGAVLAASGGAVVALRVAWVAFQAAK